MRRSASVWWALIRATWGEQLSRPIIAVMGLAYCASEMAGVLYGHELNDPTLILTLLVGAGSIGRDVTTGVLPLVFTRPFARGTYVLAKWLAVSSAAALAGVLALAVQAVWLHHRGFGLPAAAVGGAFFTAATTAVGIAALLVFLSTLVPGVGDVGLWTLLRLGGFLVGKELGPRFTQEWSALVEPALSWETLFAWDAGAWFRLVSYLSTVTLFLFAAVVSANRKELSYAAG